VNSIPIPATPPGGLLRVTLSHPVNGVLGSVARGYFVEPPAAGTDLRIDYARFADETIVYWADQAATLWSSTNVLGPWTQQTNTLPPLRIPGPAEREFYRVRK
jgi:hypothetical protein